MNEDDTTIGNPLYTFDTGKFRFEDFAKEQVHNSKSRPQGRRYCKQLLEWCAAIYKESKSAYEKFASKSPELYLPSERTLQHMLSNKKKKTVDLYLSEGMSESQAWLAANAIVPFHRTAATMVPMKNKNEDFKMKWEKEHMHLEILLREPPCNMLYNEKCENAMYWK